MRKFLAPIALMILLAVPVFHNYEKGLGVEQTVNTNFVQLPKLEDTFVFQKPLTFRERLDYQVSRGEIRYMDMETTAYDLSVESCGKSPEHPAYGITASGKHIEEGMVAVDPDVIPLGTRLYIEDYGMAVAEDTGGAIKGGRLDIFMSSKSDCKAWGVKVKRVYILGR